MVVDDYLNTVYEHMNFVKPLLTDILYIQGKKLKGGMAIKINFVLFERTFKVIYEDPVQIFRTLLGFRNILKEHRKISNIPKFRCEML
jgi:hypothetical protein